MDYPTDAFSAKLAAQFGVVLAVQRLLAWRVFRRCTFNFRRKTESQYCFWRSLGNTLISYLHPMVRNTLTSSAARVRVIHYIKLLAIITMVVACEVSKFLPSLLGSNYRKTNYYY